jgi:hypothetical protein
VEWAAGSIPFAEQPPGLFLEQKKLLSREDMLKYTISPCGVQKVPRRQMFPGSGERDERLKMNAARCILLDYPVHWAYHTIHFRFSAFHVAEHSRQFA